MKYILVGIGLSLGLSLTNGIISHVTTPSAEAIAQEEEDANVAQAEKSGRVHQCHLDYPARIKDPQWIQCIEAAHAPQDNE